jgi:hypothetical protein
MPVLFNGRLNPGPIGPSPAQANPTPGGPMQFLVEITQASAGEAVVYFEDGPTAAGPWSRRFTQFWPAPVDEGDNTYYMPVVDAFYRVTGTITGAAIRVRVAVS